MNLEQEIYLTNKYLADNFGTAVAFDGGVLAVGVPNHDYNVNESGELSNAGAVFIYVKTGDVWTEVQKIVPETRQENAQFGYSVAVSGDYILVGAPYEDKVGAMEDVGAVYLFKKYATNRWGQIKKFNYSNTPYLAADERFGNSIAMTNDYVAIGSFSDVNNSGTDPKEAAGAVYIYQNFSDHWNSTNKILSPNRSVGDLFGSSVALSGSRLLIGSPQERTDENGVNGVNFTGAAYVYRNNGPGAWIMTKKLVGTERVEFRKFGSNVDIENNQLAVSEKGAVTIYKTESLDNWEQVQKLKPETANSYFGKSVSISDNFVVVGEAHYYEFEGTVYVYREDFPDDPLTPYIFKHKLYKPGGGGNGSFGMDLMLSGDDLIIGTPYYATPDANDCGAVFYYKKQYLPECHTYYNTTDITTTSAQGQARVWCAGEYFEGIVYGLCYSTSPNPTISDDKVSEEFYANYLKTYRPFTMSGLTPNTTYYYRAFATNDYGTSYSIKNTFTTLYTDFEIRGNDIVIGNYDVSPRPEDNTDFGNVYVDSDTKVNSFKIHNTGTAPLEIGGWSVSGDFSISPEPSIINAGSSESFTIAYNPTSIGDQVKTVLINPIDINASMYRFDIKGSGNAKIDFVDGSSFLYNVQPNKINQQIGRFFLQSDLAGATLNSINIKLIGERTGLSNFKLWQSVDANLLRAEDIRLLVIENDPGNGGILNFTNLNVSIPTTGSYFFLTANVAENATGTIHSFIGGNSDIGISEGIIQQNLISAPLSMSDNSLPVELSFFNATYDEGSVLLTWATESEMNNLGFIIEKKEDLYWKLIDDYLSKDILKGQGSTSTKTNYQYEDLNVISNTTYQYRISDVDLSGNITILDSLDIFYKSTAEVAGTNDIQIFPNPFNPVTKISYSIQIASNVNLTIYNLSGGIVKNIVINENQDAGFYSYNWQGIDEKGRQLPSGIYLCVLKKDAHILTQKAILIR